VFPSTPHFSELEFMADLKQHMRVLELFPSAVQLSTHPEKERINADLIDVIDQIQENVPNSRPEDWACTVYTTIENHNELHLHPAFQEISNFIVEELNHFSETNGVFLPSSGVIIKNLWVNVYNKNDSMDVHNHPNSLFTGVYFVKSPSESASVLIDSPSSDSMISIPVIKNNDYNIENAAFESIEGQLLIFNSTIKHRVLLHKLEQKRITISFSAVI
jgi:uncharacterized protein (TIGR02466 family)